MSECTQPSQIKAAWVRGPAQSNENGPFVCAFNKPLTQWVTVVAHLCWQLCCPFCISETELAWRELPVPATYQPPVTPNTVVWVAPRSCTQNSSDENPVSEFIQTKRMLHSDISVHANYIFFFNPVVAFCTPQSQKFHFLSS